MKIYRFILVAILLVAVARILFTVPASADSKVPTITVTIPADCMRVSSDGSKEIRCVYDLDGEDPTIPDQRDNTWWPGWPISPDKDFAPKFRWPGGPQECCV